MFTTPTARGWVLNMTANHSLQSAVNQAKSIRDTLYTIHSGNMRNKKESWKNATGWCTLRNAFYHIW